MTTLQPRPAYTADELSTLFPPSLELQQVQILLRHGERTPVNSRFRNAGLPAHWSYCHAANALKSAVLQADGSWDSLTWKRRIETLGEGGAPELRKDAKGGADAICQPGELTDRGRETTLALGERIRRLYVDQLGFLPAQMQAEGRSVNLHSTPIPRALESVQQAFLGLYPPSRRAAGAEVPTIVTRSMQDETLFPNEQACKRFAELARGFADRAAKLYNDSPEMATINRKIGKWMPADSPQIKVDSHPRLSGVMDTVNATLAHGSATKLPKEFYDQGVLDAIDRVAVEEWFGGYQESEEYRRLGIGGLVGDLTQKMVEHATQNSPSTSTGNHPFKLSMAGCHDTTLASTLASLGAFETARDKWPNFTSSIAVELFKHKTPNPSTSPSGTAPTASRPWYANLFSRSAAPPSSRTPLASWPVADRATLDSYYVRLRYNDRAVTLPYCKAAGRHLQGDESFCTLSAFKEAADSFTPNDWKKECSSNLGQPAVRPVIERPPGVDV